MRFLLLAIMVTMLVEVMIFIPSLRNFREAQLNQWIERGDLLIQTLLTAPNNKISHEFEMAMLKKINAHYIERTDKKMTFFMSDGTFTRMRKAINYTQESFLDSIYESCHLIFANKTDRYGEDKIYIEGASHIEDNSMVRIIFNRSTLEKNMIDFAWRILALSLLLSIATGLSIFIILQYYVVRPVNYISNNLVAFADDPKNQHNIITPAYRQDEIGEVQSKLHDMQYQLHHSFLQQNHLAALGGAMARIQHDLRNILSNAILVFDTLEQSKDAKVKKIAPVVMNSINNAVELCSTTLDYVNSSKPALHLQDICLSMIIDELRNMLSSQINVQNNIIKGTVIYGDRHALYRVLDNLTRNAINAHANIIEFYSDKKTHDHITIYIKDNGHGIDETTQAKLFKPFESSHKSTGLGLSIAKELLSSHDATITLNSTNAQGTIFAIAFKIKP